MKLPSNPPLLDEEIEELDKFLLDADELEESMDVSMLDGFLCAVLSGPKLIMPSEWIRWVWDSEKGRQVPKFRSQRYAERILSLVIRHSNDIALTLIQSPSEYEPLFYERRLIRKLITIVDEWCYGYLKGVALDERGWAPLQWAHPEWFEAINLFGSLDHHDRRFRLIEERPDADARHQQWVDRIVPAVLRIHAYWLEKRTPARGETAGHRKPKEKEKAPGRDALCPCGSGKKYKQCHGSPQSLH